MDTEKPSELRPYNEATSTRKTSIWGLTASCIFSLGCVIAIIATVSSQNLRDASYPVTKIPGRIHGNALAITLPLLLAIIVTLCNECLGLIHTVSLRWALMHEDRLHFNTNLRLLTAARTSSPNSWYVNIFTILVSAISYTAAGQCITNTSAPANTAYEFKGPQFNLAAMGILAFGLSSQAAVAVWALVVMGRQIPTWSANSLNNSLACQHVGLQHHTGRSLVPYSRNDISVAVKSAKPLERQTCLGNTRPAAKMVVGLLWFSAIATLVWAGITNSLDVPYDNRGGRHSTLLQTGKGTGWAFETNDSGQPHWVGALIAIAFSLVTQVMYTFSLHCMELLVNATRDEKIWRAASELHKDGAPLNKNAIQEACTSWETILLFFLKTAVHWAFGEAVVMNIQGMRALFNIWARSLFLLAALMAVVAIFGTWLCFRRFTGPQPAVYGHFQTLTDLIDDWGKDDQPIYWGDKGHIAWDAEGEVRRAGTAGFAESLGPIHMDAKYR